MVTVRPDDKVRLAAKLVEENDIWSVVVVEGDTPIGIVTERDFVQIVALEK